MVCIISTSQGQWTAPTTKEALEKMAREAPVPLGQEPPPMREQRREQPRLSWWRPAMVKHGACGCKAGETSERTPIYAWPWLRVRKRIIGARWYGWPWPLRLRWRGVRMRVADVRRWQWPIFVKQMPGCGCIKLLKDGWLRLWKIKRRLI